MNIYEFTEKLAGVKFHMVFEETSGAGQIVQRPKGAIRDDAGRCPILALAGANLGDNVATIAGRLGLSDSLAAGIINAADGDLVGMRIGWADDFRAQLLA